MEKTDITSASKLEHEINKYFKYADDTFFSNLRRLINVITSANTSQQFGKDEFRSELIENEHLDLDFIKYSLEDNSIKTFINELNKSVKDISFEITDEIIPLHHQDYNGKRVFLKIKDKFNNVIDTKMDIGVHKLFEVE